MTEDVPFVETTDDTTTTSSSSSSSSSTAQKTVSIISGGVVTAPGFEPIVINAKAAEEAAKTEKEVYTPSVTVTTKDEITYNNVQQEE